MDSEPAGVDIHLSQKKQPVEKILHATVSAFRCGLRLRRGPHLLLWTSSLLTQPACRFDNRQAAMSFFIQTDADEKDESGDSEPGQ